MRVGIDAACWSNPRGYGRYARGLVTALLAEPGSHEYVLFVDAQTHAAWPLPAGAQVVVAQTAVAPSEAASAEGRRSVRDLWAMSRAAARTPLDLLFFPSVYTFFPVTTRVPVILGIHDVIAETFPKLVFPQRSSRIAWGVKGWLARRTAARLLTVSDYAKTRIAAHFRWPADRIDVVGEAPDPVFEPLTDDPTPIFAARGQVRPVRYLICLGGLNPHKNLGMLVEALAELHPKPEFADVQLVLVGPTDDDRFTPGAAALRDAVARLGLADGVHFMGYLPDHEVAVLLSHAVALVMPSLEEGYGLGAVEAAACGTPVIVTRNSPLPALLADGGIPIDPTDPAELRRALTALLSDDALRVQMGRAARERTAALTWSRSAAQFRAILDKFTR